MRHRSLLLAVGVIASGLLVGQQAAEAAPQRVTATCTIAAPAKMTLNAPKIDLKIPLGKDCPRTLAEAWWTARTDLDTVEGGIPGLTTGYGIDQYAWLSVHHMVIGKPTTWVPDGYGKDVNGRKVADLRRTTSMTKCGAAVGLSGVRIGTTKTTLSARPSYYSVKARTFVRHHGRVLFQSRNIGSTTWTDLAYANPNSAGVATYTLTTNRSRDYRVYVPSSSTVWYAYSATKRV